jgi:predicted transcriptional regulator
MAKGVWKDRVERLMIDAKEEAKGGKAGGLKLAERHQSILRKKLLLSLIGATKRSFITGANAHKVIGNEIDSIVDSLIVNSETDGMDLDGELIGKLTDISAKLFAIDESWEEIIILLNNK